MEKNRTIRFVRRVKNYFKEYCGCTGIHGFRYFGEPRTYFERGWWFFVFVICLSGCGWLISLVYAKWEDSPVLVSFSTTQTPIYEIPFPAVTICPDTKSNKTLYNHSRMIKRLINKDNLTFEEYLQVSVMNLMCDLNPGYDKFKHYKDYITDDFDNGYLFDSEVFDFLYNVTPNPYDIFDECHWMNNVFDCKEGFQPIITDEGLCYTFNMLDFEQIYKDNVILPKPPFSNEVLPKNSSWSLGEGYKADSELHTYPQRALLSGAQNALNIKLKESHENTDFTCMKSSQGFKVTLHTPGRIPRPSEQYLKVPLNEVVVIALQPAMITTSATVKNFHPSKRQCYFENERPLQYFQKYSQKNCDLECLTNFTLFWCECINFSMPRERLENDTYLCGTMSIGCMKAAAEILQHQHLDNLFNKKKRKEKIRGTKVLERYLESWAECDCLPLCSDLNYDVETSSSHWNWKKLYETFYDNNSLEADKINFNGSMANLIIYFKNSQFTASKRHELYGPTDFIANFGGLLGLFTGFSILSLMEIIYFLTVRIICNIRLYGNWSGSDK